MSIKAVHVVFIFLAVMVSFGFGVWGLHSRSATGSTLHMALGVSSLTLGAALVVYGVAFLRKMKALKL